MELINNRYRVIKAISENFYITKYLVSDILRRQQLLCLNILNPNNVTQEVITFLNNEFVALKASNCKGVVNIFEYSVMNSIDNLPVKDEIYFYCTEYLENVKNTFEVLKNLNLEDRINIFADICCTVNTLHYKGIIYDDLMLESIHIIEQDGNFTVKLKDVVAININKFSSRGTIEKSYTNFEEFQSENCKLAYFLTLLLLKLFENYEGEKEKDLILKMVSKIVADSQQRNNGDISKLIKLLNKTYNKAFDKLYFEELERLNFKTKLTGRSTVKQQIQSACSAAIRGESRGTLVGIHGETGGGKSRLLNEVIHWLKISRAKVFCHSRTDFPESGQGIIELIRQMLLSTDSEMSKKYEEEFSVLIPSLYLEREAAIGNVSLRKKDRYKLINRMAALLNEISKVGPCFLIVDDIDCCDELYIELLEYIFEDEKSGIMAVFTFNNSSLNAETRFREFYNKIKHKASYEDIKLKPLNEEETTVMVKNILSTPIGAEEIGKRIYSFTYGNPLFIEEIVKNLFLKQYIYIDKVSGIWSTNYKNIKEIPIPLDLEQAMLNQIKGIGQKNKQLIANMAVFNGETDLRMLSAVSEIDELEIQLALSELIKKGIIIEKLSEKGVFYDYSNRILKKMMYDRLEVAEKREKHKKAADIIEGSINETGHDYRDELIYHLEGSGEGEKLLKYCISNAERLEKKNIREGAVKYLEKALSIFDENSLDSRCIELLLKLGDLYRRNGNMQNSLKYYIKCIELSDHANQTDIQINAILKVSTIYFNKNEIDKCIKYLDKAERMLLNCNEYTEGRLDVNLLKIKIYELKQQYAKAFQVAWESLELCSEKQLKYKGRIYKALGRLFFYTGDIHKALINFEESIGCFEKISYLKGTLTPLNNIGVIWGDYYQDDGKSLEYFLKLKEISERNSFLESDIVALSNIGENQFYKFQYDEALKCFIEALEKSERFLMEASVFYNNIYILYTYLMLQDYRSVQKYLVKINEELIQHPEQGITIRDYYKVLSILYLKLGELERAESFALKAVKKYNGEDCFGRWHTQYIGDLVSIYASKDGKEVDKIVDDIINVMSRIKSKEVKADILYNTAFALFLSSHEDKCLNLLSKFQMEPEEIRTKVKKLYLESQLVKEEGKGYTEKLMTILSLAEKCKDHEVSWRICCALGDYYYHRQNYFYSVNYYFQAAEIIKNLTNSVSEDYKVSYFNFNNMIEPFYKLLRIKDVYEKQDVILENCWGTVKTEQEIDKLFKYENIKSILSSNEFLKSAQNIFDITHNNSVRDVKDLLSGLSSDPIYNLEVIVKYLGRLTLAKDAYIIYEELNRNVSVLSSVKPYDDQFHNRFILDKVHSSKEPFVITDRMLDDDKYRFETFQLNNKVIICIPILINKSLRSGDLKIERRNKNSEVSQLLGYIYLESERLLNNFNQKTLSACQELVPLIGFIIEKYQLRISSSIDKLTGTFTRKSLEESLEEQVYRCRNTGGTFTAIMFDLDHFKQINDRFGHQTGDDILKKVCSTVQRGMRKGDICGRYGGEEFVIVLPGTDLSGGEVVAEKIRKSIEKSKLLGNRANVTISMGVSNYPMHGDTVKELIEKADQALYKAKKSGRNRIQTWSEEFRGEVSVSNRLAGIVTGDPVQDYRNVSVIIEIINLVKSDRNSEDKIYKFLGRIIEVTEAQQGSLYTLEEDNIAARYSRRIFEEGWCSSFCSEDIIREVITAKKGRCLIDWDEVYDYDSKKGIPDWKSLCVVPVISCGKVKAVVALTVSAKIKEFKIDDLNFISVLAQLSEGII